MDAARDPRLARRMAHAPSPLVVRARTTIVLLRDGEAEEVELTLDGDAVTLQQRDGEEVQLTRGQVCALLDVLLDNEGRYR